MEYFGTYRRRLAAAKEYITAEYKWDRVVPLSRGRDRGEVDGVVGRWLLGGRILDE